MYSSVHSSEMENHEEPIERGNVIIKPSLLMRRVILFLSLRPLMIRSSVLLFKVVQRLVELLNHFLSLVVTTLVMRGEREVVMATLSARFSPLLLTTSESRLRHQRDNTLLHKLK